MRGTPSFLSKKAKNVHAWTLRNERVNFQRFFHLKPVIKFFRTQLFIKNNNLYNNIRLLGLIDYEEVFSLIKFSKAVINPSLFEGWSSTVEECKSVGKNMILSDLDVHIEQYPSATFFERNSIKSLKFTLLNYDNSNLSNDIESIEKRTEIFSNKYLNIIKEVLNAK